MSEQQIQSQRESLALALRQLRQRPSTPVQCVWNGNPVTACLGLPDYQAKLAAHYQMPASRFDRFPHLGLIIVFDSPTELALHDDNMELPQEARDLMAEFGPVILRNAYLSEAIQSVGHRNRFPHLSFHRDRNEHQPTPYSLFYRDPFDEEQQHPRTASTLFISNQHTRAELQASGLGIDQSADLSHCFLFDKIPNPELISKFLGSMILEQGWNMPQGTGEICLQDNRQLMHCSYYRTASRDGWRIGVRYLA